MLPVAFAASFSSFCCAAPTYIPHSTYSSSSSVSLYLPSSAPSRSRCLSHHGDFPPKEKKKMQTHRFQVVRDFGPRRRLPGKMTNIFSSSSRDGEKQRKRERERERERKREKDFSTRPFLLASFSLCLPE